MTIARKLTMALLGCVLIALGLSTVASVRRETSRFEEQMAEHEQIMGRALRPAVAQVWRTDGAERALQVVEEANQGLSAVDIRWVWLDATPSEAKWRPWSPSDEIAEVKSGQDRQWTDHVFGGSGRSFSYVAMNAVAGRPGALEISESLSPEHEVRRVAIRQSLLTALAVLIASGVVAGGLGFLFIGRPMRTLVAYSERVGAGDFSQRIALTPRDEVGALAGAMNAMVSRLAAAQAREQEALRERLRALEDLRHADRLATVGRLAAGMAHELGTPLNVVSARAKPIANGQVGAEGASASACIIVEQVERMAGLMRQLLDFARKRPLQKRNADLGELARHTASLLGSLAAKRGVALEVEATDTPIRADVDPMQIEQVITNLVMNAVHATEKNTAVKIRISRTERAQTDGAGAAACACIEISDCGPGISDADLPRIFEPFFSTKAIGEGTGLGLSVAYGIVGDHAGWIEVETAPGAGSRFSVFLPLERS